MEAQKTDLVRLLTKSLIEIFGVSVESLAKMKTYKIQSHWKHIDGEWHDFFPFTCMRKSFVDGAWAMLKAHYGGDQEFRLIEGENKVIDTWGSPMVSTNKGK